MTHYRPPGSIPYLIMQTMSELSPDEVKRATGKASETFGTISRPTNDMELHFQDAISLDLAREARGLPALFFPHFAEIMIDAETVHEPIPLMKCMLRVMSEVGDVSKAVEDAKNPTSEGGIDISPNEARTIGKQAYEAIVQLKEIIRAVDIKKPEEVKGL